MKEGQPRNKEKLGLKYVLGIGITAGFMTGAVADHFWGRETGVKTGIGVGGTELGLLAGLVSTEEAERLLDQGKKFKSLLWRVKAFFEIAAGYGIGGGTLGYALNKEIGPMIGIAAGVLIGGMTELALSTQRLSNPPTESR